MVYVILLVTGWSWLFVEQLFTKVHKTPVYPARYYVIKMETE